MDRTTYKRSLGGFVGVDLSSDPMDVANGRLAYSVNMWRDYESAQGGCVETFPGYRALRSREDWGAFGHIRGLYHYKAINGEDYVIVHKERELWAFTDGELSGALVGDGGVGRKLYGRMSDSASTGFVFNNALYILDGVKIYRVRSIADEDGEVEITAGEFNGYVPTTYLNGKPYEQRNMLTDTVYQKETGQGEEVDVDALPYVIEVSEYEEVEEDGETVEVYRIDVSEGSFEYRDRIDVIVKYSTTAATKRRIEVVGTGYPSATDVYIYVSGNVADGAEFPVIQISYCRNAVIHGYAELGEYTYAEKFNINASGHVQIYGMRTSDSPRGVIFENQRYFDNWVSGLSEAYESIRADVKSAYEAMDLRRFPIYEAAKSGSVTGNVLKEYGEVDINGETKRVLKALYVRADSIEQFGFEARLSLYPGYFSTPEIGTSSFPEDHPDYKESWSEAIYGCTKSAIYDGRIFLTGNPALPNTVFWTHRNLTGVNDPTYFGVYNYLNDGVGNTPNVELLATPSYLMVIKGDTVQDASVYYHVAQDNPTSDEVLLNLLPRIYPSEAGAAGLGSAGVTEPGCTAVNFLDDPLFISRRGVECVEKQQLNLERALTHRSSNVDRLLIKEDLAHAVLAEWKGYLVILCNGNAYLADSRALHQHADGSYQYEWFYLSGIGAYNTYRKRFKYCTSFPFDNDSGIDPDDYKLAEESGYVDPSAQIDVVTVGDIEVYTTDGYLIEQVDGEVYGTGDFYGANKMIAVGERLYFGTPNGYILCVNTDKRGEEGFIPREWYSFCGCAFESGCATRLDDCGDIGEAKCTIPGTAVIHLKMMPGSRCNVNVSTNGRDFKRIFTKAIPSSRFDFSDFDFSNFNFTENESNVSVMREMTRNFVHKQYYVYSDGYKEPFGLYELTYKYYVRGKIRK